MATDIIQGWNVGSGEPLDAKSVKADASARYAISPVLVYEGLVVYQQDNNKLYVLTDVANVGNASGWTEVGAGTGT